MRGAEVVERAGWAQSGWLRGCHHQHLTLALPSSPSRSRLPNGETDLASMHAAKPVGSGEKWILTRWCKELEPSDY